MLCCGFRLMQQQWQQQPEQQHQQQHDTVVTLAYLGATATGLHAQLRLLTAAFKLFPSLSAIAAAVVPKAALIRPVVDVESASVLKQRQRNKSTYQEYTNDCLELTLRAPSADSCCSHFKQCEQYHRSSTVEVQPVPEPRPKINSDETQQLI